MRKCTGRSSGETLMRSRSSPKHRCGDWRGSSRAATQQHMITSNGHLQRVRQRPSDAMDGPCLLICQLARLPALRLGKGVGTRFRLGPRSPSTIEHRHPKEAIPRWRGQGVAAEHGVWSLQAIGRRISEKVCHTDGRKTKRGGRDDGNGGHEKKKSRERGFIYFFFKTSIDRLEMRGYPLVVIVDA